MRFMTRRTAWLKWSMSPKPVVMMDRILSCVKPEKNQPHECDKSKISRGLFRKNTSFVGFGVKLGIFSPFFTVISPSFFGGNWKFDANFRKQKYGKRTEVLQPSEMVVWRWWFVLGPHPELLRFGTVSCQKMITFFLLWKSVKKK